MPEYNTRIGVISVQGRVYALDPEDPNAEVYEDEALVHDDDLDGIQLVLHDDFDFMNMTDDEAINMVNDILPELTQQVLSSILTLRDQLQVADTIATLCERAEAGDADWEL
jgi:hypothetical protein